MKNLPYKGYIKPNYYKNELIHTNIFSLIKDTAPYTRYLHLFTKNTTKALTEHLIPNKSATSVLLSFDSYRKATERPNRPIQRLYTDKDSIYKSNLLNDYHYKHGII